MTHTLSNAFLATVILTFTSFCFSQEIREPTSPAIAELIGPERTTRVSEEQNALIQKYIARWNLKFTDLHKPSELDSVPIIISMASPIYPPEMHRASIEGSVIIGFIVDKNGNVALAFPIDDRPEDFSFAAAAVVAAWSWKFEPGIKNGVPVMSRMRVPVNFKLNTPKQIKN
ncbi:MAG: TonB family protein [Verrucomicrobia bacterium]|nr:TonB family protein [Verrucomicrobiota bacterium]